MKDAGSPADLEEVGQLRGEFDENGRLLDLDGHELTRTKTRLTIKQAMALIGAGASAASEPCGCGGWAGCQPQWLDKAELDSLLAVSKPITRKGGSPTWIDAWTNETSTLVFAHGDIVWTSDTR